MFISPEHIVFLPHFTDPHRFHLMDQWNVSHLHRYLPSGSEHNLFISLHAFGFIQIRTAFSCNQIALEVN